ncbi:uncharacterized protein BP01DRAFT_45502 [Aspergillus saccharolyticus JOP 1030-1]|uniref:Uncharacterized protein n=1 Tax=Aspergillus saccharolyticus JOP 1030-1 TaxID=1450539 RepID=A0A318ZCY9_9EURO|nr:hypothetical protein BP01DRAFT_45502 [Aspergillus saccharolyticus JOP 1030-1]PYH45205.1 hypothetical protein BP01DRAFT_45502 [Aspergillus saccharolyticus JOP 1030-1]
MLGSCSLPFPLSTDHRPTAIIAVLPPPVIPPPRQFLSFHWRSIINIPSLMWPPLPCLLQPTVSVSNEVTALHESPSCHLFHLVSIFASNLTVTKIRNLPVVVFIIRTSSATARVLRLYLTINELFPIYKRKSNRKVKENERGEKVPYLL